MFYVKAVQTSVCAAFVICRKPLFTRAHDVKSYLPHYFTSKKSLSTVFSSKSGFFIKNTEGVSLPSPKLKNA
jgi:hypothetical protein